MQADLHDRKQFLQELAATHQKPDFIILFFSWRLVFPIALKVSWENRIEEVHEWKMVMILLQDLIVRRLAVSSGTVEYDVSYWRLDAVVVY